MAQPFCPVMRRWLLEASKGVTSTRAHDRGTYVCMEGPAFSTKAESNMHRQWGGDLIGMTAMPEAKLAREAEIPYCTIAMVTDYDCWHPGHDNVSVDTIVETLQANARNANNLIAAVVPNMKQRPAVCPSGDDQALDGSLITDPVARDPELIAKLDAVAGRVLNS
mgnify:CR=1 FL=1